LTIQRVGADGCVITDGAGNLTIFDSGQEFVERYGAAIGTEVYGSGKRKVTIEISVKGN